MYSETDVDSFYGKYKIIILAALMMMVGAILEDAMVDYLHRAVPTVSVCAMRQEWCRLTFLRSKAAVDMLGH
jgi:energy-converting hydrogenase Eha subunit E